MLVIGRHLHESVILTGGIRITVVRVGRDRVKLGFEAPPEVAIVREELIPDEAMLAGRPADPRKLDDARKELADRSRLEREARLQRRQQRQGGR